MTNQDASAQPATMLSRRRAMLAALSLAPIVAASGCRILPQLSEPVDLYTLTPKTTFDQKLPDVSWQLVVEVPDAAAGLATSKIAVARSPFTFEYFANAAWTDSAPNMVQNLMIESFESTRHVTGVGRETLGLRPDYLLKTDLREFQAIYNGDNPVPQVLVRINAKLVRMPERRIVAADTFESRAEAAGRTFVDVVEAFDTALGGVIKRVVVFTLTAVPPTVDRTPVGLGSPTAFNGTLSAPGQNP